MVNVAFGMIVFEGNYVLKECLESIYPHAKQILIAEGPVKYWQERGKKTSEDGTNDVLSDFPDPENKIKIVHGQYSEKDEQCNAYMDLMDDDIDYLWQVDSDEVYKESDIIKTKEFLEENRPTSVGVRSCSFFGGFNHYMTGFELAKDNFLRIFKVRPGSRWVTHRPPTMGYLPEYAKDIEMRHIDSDTFYDQTGVQMYHYSYVFPEQVRKKIEYYKSKVSMSKCIDGYYHRVYLSWTTGDKVDRQYIEKLFKGVHEFKPEYRGECYTERFTGEHPESILKNMKELKRVFLKQREEIYG